MQSTQTCPKCSGKKFAVTDEFRHPDQESSNMTRPFPAITIIAHRVDQVRTGPWARETLGSFETWICLGCGYTEFYARGIEQVEEIAKRWPERVRIVDAGPAALGPYR